MSRIARREFLKAGSAAAAAAVYVGEKRALGFDAAGAVQTGVAPRIGDTAYTPMADYPIRAQRYSAVTLTDTFWKPKVATNATVTIPGQVARFAEIERGFSGNVLEAAILSLATHPDAKLQAQVDARVRQIVREPAAGNRGFEVAATYFAVTGKRDLLDHALPAAAALYETHRTEDPPFSGGERDATNCIALYRATGDKKHLDLAKHYLDIRGLPNSVNRSRHNQSYKPVLEQTEAVGHAVNGVTLMLSMADVGILSGLRPYFDTAHQAWRDIVERKLYVTGGVGTTGNEGFGEPYSLPNISAYAETCAVLMFITFNHRLFLATGDSQYIDVMERGMYNNAIDGVSTSGRRFFYVNRLASAGDGRDARWERASLECCPPNMVRFLASMPGYIYAQDDKGAIYVNLYVSSTTSFTVEGKPLGVSVKSEMPWGGRSHITISAKEDVRATVKLRVPGWARNRPVPSALYAYAGSSDGRVTVAVNGQSTNAAPDTRGYVSIDRMWKNGDAVDISFAMESRRVIADARVAETRRRTAIERGPIVYCAEAPDVDGGRALDLLLEASAPLPPAREGGFYEGVTVINTAARSVRDESAPPRSVKLIPYHLWANRAAGEMSVWLSTAPFQSGDVGPAGGFIFYDNPNHRTDGWRYLEAAPFDQSAGAAWGCFRRAIAGASGTAVGTGKQNTADMLTACAEAGTAAFLCANLSINGVRGWFLPSREELALMYRHLKAKGLGAFHDGGLSDNVSYWASSQLTADMAAHIDFADLGRLHHDDKDFPRRVRAIRMI
jgi:uncharacterized protein